MKKIEAIVRPEKLEPLKDALIKLKIDGMTINQVYGCGNQLGWTEHIRGAEVILNTVPKVQIMMVVADDRVEEIIQLICQVAETGGVGDGKIFIYDVLDCVRIRTCERGEAAL
jgi:nitrogen regulatory protein P-II 1